jgi:hypothetical protein
MNSESVSVMTLFADFDRKQVIDATRDSLRWTSATLKVLFVSVGSIAAVVFASLIISIIQFQLRLSEARTQNGNISLESIALIADYQDYVSNHYKSVRRKAETLEQMRGAYQVKLNSTGQLIAGLCTTINPEKADACSSELKALINNSTNQVDAVVAQYKSGNSSQNDTVAAMIKALKDLISSGTLPTAYSDLVSTQQSVVSQCRMLTQYVSERYSTTSLLGVSPELRMTITVQCSDGNLVEGPTMQLQSAEAPTTGQGPVAGEPEVQRTNDVSGVNRILLSELVFYYRFYDWLTSFMGANFRQFILSPPEFIVILLVIATGTLGSFLFNTYVMFVAKSRNDFPTFAAILLRATLAVMCALVIYILSRTGFVAITDGGQRNNEVVISPFVIAFISVAAGLLAESALERIRAIGLNALNSTRQNDDQRPQPPTPQSAEG